MKNWLSASEIAKLKLPGLPSSKVAIATRAERERWPTKAATGLGGQRRVYQVPDSYLRSEAARSPSEHVYDPTAGTGQMLTAASEFVAKARQEGKMDDADLIREVVLGVERWLERNQLQADVEKKAALISLLFRYFQTEGRLDEAKMDKLLKAVG